MQLSCRFYGKGSTFISNGPYSAKFTSGPATIRNYTHVAAPALCESQLGPRMTNTFMLGMVALFPCVALAI